MKPGRQTSVLDLAGIRASTAEGKTFVHLPRRNRRSVTPTLLVGLSVPRYLHPVGEFEDERGE